MDIEGRVRSRIEAILLHDARQHAELKDMASEDEPSIVEPFSEERALFERIIASYRSAIVEVNGLLEENIEFLSAFCRIIEKIKYKVDVEEICVDIAHGVLEDFEAEYCGMVFHLGLENDGQPFCLEGTREDHEFLRIHGGGSLSGSPRSYEVVANLAKEGPDNSLNIPDVYRDARFQAVDWPSVVRSLVCATVTHQGEDVGMLILGHSTPSYFRENHVRILRVLAGIIGHVRLLASATVREGPAPQVGRPPEGIEEPDTLSVVLLQVESPEPRPGVLSPAVKTLLEIRNVLAGSLQGRDSVSLHRGDELLLLFPGVTPERLSSRVSHIRRVFRAWQAGHPDPRCAGLRMNIGFATCGAGDDLARVLELASAVLHAELEDEPQSEAVGDRP